MWRNPLAYGHATATRIFFGGLVPLTDANHRERSPQDPPCAECTENDQQESGGREQPEPEIAPLSRSWAVTVGSPSAHRRSDGPASRTCYR